MKNPAKIAGVIALGIFVALGGYGVVSDLYMNTVEVTRFTVQDENLFMVGEINGKTDEQFEAVIAANPQITTIVECIVPGSMDDDTMIPLSYRVRELGLNTHVTSTSFIASGGVDFFLAGVERTMETGAIVGVHSWADPFRDAADYPRDAPQHEANATYVRDMLGDDAFYWFTIYAAPANGLYEMSPAEMQEYGMLTAAPMAAGAGPACPSTP